MIDVVAAAGPAIPTIDYSGQVQGAATSGMSVLSDNVLYLLAIPVAWVGYKIVRKVIAKIG